MSNEEPREMKIETATPRPAPSQTGWLKTTRSKVIAGITAGVLLVGAGASCAYAIHSANNRQAALEAIAQINDAEHQLLAAEAFEPQAAYLLVDKWNQAEETHLAQLKTISTVPEKLISKETITPVQEAHEAAMERFAKDSSERPADGLIEQYALVAEQLEDRAAEFAPDEAVDLKPEDLDGRVNGERVRELETQAADATARAEEAMGVVDDIENRIDLLESQIIEDAGLLAGPAAEALKNQDAFSKAYSKAGKTEKEQLSKRAEMLQSALDTFNGVVQADEAVEAEPASRKYQDQSADPVPAAERLAFKRTVTDSVPSLEQAEALLTALSSYVSSASAVQGSHDKAVKAEKKAAEEAAAAAAAAAGTGYTDPGTGQWINTGGGGGGNWTDNSGGAPWTGGGSSSGGSGSSSSGGSSGGGGGGSYVPGGGNCPAPPAGWYPTGGTANGCPTYNPPGGDADGW
ncbi:MAG: hypothetical protein ACK5LO_13605 [Leucobacter sp.]